MGNVRTQAQSDASDRYEAKLAKVMIRFPLENREELNSYVKTKYAETGLDKYQSVNKYILDLILQDSGLDLLKVE